MTEGDVFTGKSQTEVLMYWPSEYIKAEVWGFPCNDRTDELINKLLYGLFSAIFKTNTIKTPDVILNISLLAIRCWY